MRTKNRKMKLKIPRTNLQSQLIKIRDRKVTEKHLLNEINNIFTRIQKEDEAVLKEIHHGNRADDNGFDPDLLETSRIFHLDHIYRLCVDYRLRFLDSVLFKADVPYEALIEIKDLEKAHGTSLRGFKIVAPSKAFKLRNADDPLLFAPIGNGYYYLIHKWVNDLNPFRKLLMWPFKTLENFIFLLLISSFLTALLIPEGMFSREQTSTEFFMLFFFVFKWFAGLSIFYGFKMGKNFSTEIWNSKYYNA